MKARRWVAAAVAAAVLASVGVTVQQGVASAETTDLGGLCGTEPSAFGDDPGGEAGVAIACIARYRIALGVTEDEFRPSRPVTRGQMGSFLARLSDVAGVGLPDQSISGFPDTVGSTHARSVAKIAAAGITTGRPDGTYGANRPVTRAQMATFIDRLLQQARFADPAPAPDAFVDDEGSVHEPAIDRVASLGIAGGIGSGRFAPDSPVTRGQMALFMARTLSVLSAELHVPPAQPGELVVVISGLPSGVTPLVTVGGPGGSQALRRSEAIAVSEGTYTVAAEPVAVPGGTLWPATLGGSPAEAAGSGSAELVTIDDTRSGASIRVHYGTLVPDTTVVLDEASTLSAVVDGTTVTTDRPLVEGGHVVGQPVDAAPQGFAYRTTGVSARGDGTYQATIAPAELQEAVPAAVSEPLPGQPGASTVEAASTSVDQPVECSGGEMQFEAEVDMLVEPTVSASWGSLLERPRVNLTVAARYSSTMGIQFAGSSCKDLEIPLPGLGSSVATGVGPVKVKLAWGARLFAKPYLSGTVGLDWKHNGSLLLRGEFPAFGLPSVSANLADVDGILAITGEASGGIEAGLRLGIDVRGPVDVKTEVAVAAAAHLSEQIDTRGGRYMGCAVDAAVSGDASAEVAGWDGRATITPFSRRVWECSPNVALPGDPGYRDVVLRTPDGDAHWVDGQGIRHWIPDQATWTCRTAHAQVEDVSRQVVDDMSEGPWDACHDVANLTGKVLRHSDGDAHYIHPDGTRTWIPDLPTWECRIASGVDVVETRSRQYVDSIRNTGWDYCLDTTTLAGRIVRHAVDGDAYYVHPDGTKTWIPDVPTWECRMAQSVQVVDTRWREYLDNIPGTEWDYCLDSSTLSGRVLRHVDDGDAYYVHADGAKTWIPDGPTWECRMRQGVEVVDTRWREYIDHIAGTEWDHCYDINTMKGRIVRHSEGDAHLVDDDGVRHWIPDGGVYECLVAQGYEVVDVRWRDYIDRMSKGPDAHCP